MAPQAVLCRIQPTMTRDRLPNSPLAQVACEIRFRGDLSLYEVWGRFQRGVRGDFPKLFVPTAMAGVSPLTQSMKLDSADGANSILLAINSFAFSTERYEDFQRFRGRFLDLQGLFCKLLELSALTRFGLRYVNFLPPVGDDGTLGARVHPCLTLELSVTPGNTWISQPQFVVEKNAGRCVLRTALLTVQNVTSFAPGLLQVPASMLPGLMPGVQLDLDCYSNAPCGIGDLPMLLDEAHDTIENAFFGMITDDYLSYLKGNSK
jgi:uncharacterized protein (TIGR04255 family)